MQTKVFISGKNWKLSLAELINYFKSREIKFEIQLFNREFFCINILQVFDDSSVADLGGTIKIADTKLKFQTTMLKEAFKESSKQFKSNIASLIASSGLVDEMPKTSKKVFFGVSVYSADKTLRPLSGVIQRFVGSRIKEELSNFNTKSKFMGFSKERNLAQLTQVEVIKKNLVENKAEVLVCIDKDETFVATTVAVHDPFEFQKRDVYKPNQRRIFAIPPRIARIMVNLSSCTPGKVFLDPFCGVGTILQEALLEKANVIGVDASPWCVKAANENLVWLTKEYNLEKSSFRVVQGEVSRLAQKIGLETVDCIATEPDLGPALRQVPTGPYASKIIQKLLPLYSSFFAEAQKVLKNNGHLVFVTPYIITRSGQAVTMPIDEKLNSLGFKKVFPFTEDTFSTANIAGVKDLVDTTSLVEVDERHKIGREIHIHQK